MYQFFKFTLLSLCLVCIAFTSNLYSQEAESLVKAKEFLNKNLQKLNLSSSDIADLTISDYYVSKHNNVQHLYLKQNWEGVEVFTAMLNINFLEDGRILNHGNRLVSNLENRANASAPAVQAHDAILSTIKALNINTTIKNPVLKEQLNDHHFIFEADGISLNPIPVRLVYEVTPKKEVRLAWMLSIYELDAQHWWNARIDAQTGMLIGFHDQVIHCNFGTDQSCNDDNHHHYVNASTTKANNLIEDFTGPDSSNAYHVYAMPVQSPIHGTNSLVICPSDSTASPFGWHDTDGIEGPEFTITRGNNVHAYQDIANLNTSISDEPDGGDSLYFNFSHDVLINTPYAQKDASVTNLFYWNNIIHDVFYQYGFDEVSGNFQTKNYTGEGIEGDWVVAEAMDGFAINNANFATGADGIQGRMQMFIWGDRDSLILPDIDITNQNILLTVGQDTIDFYEPVLALFGGSFPNPALTSTIVLVDDSTDVATDACQDIINGSEITGNIVMIDRGTCEFGTKALRGQNEGAIAVIICNNVATAPVAMPPGVDGGDVTIPAMMLSRADCDSIKLHLNGNNVTFNPPTTIIPQPGPKAFDGDFDNGIITHEYGHGISARLTGGPSVGFQCLSNAEQAGEGWSDWFGLVLTTDETNTADQPQGIANYAVNAGTDGAGIRTYPYSRDMNVNPHTYQNITDFPNSVHGVGSIWCAMIWDLYWNLIDEYGYDEDKYRGTKGNNIAIQLVIDGLKLQTCNPSFIDARDGILAADMANYDGANQCLIWETFARRGLGVDAAAGGTESFDIPESCKPVRLEKVAIDIAEANDTITYSIVLIDNLLSLNNDAIFLDSFPEGTEYVEGSLNLPIANIDDNVLSIDGSNINIGDTIFISYQLKVNSSPFSIIDFFDNVEDGTSDWTTESPIGDNFWAINRNSFAGEFAWKAVDINSMCDQYLVLNVPQRLERANPAMTFQHRYDTESTWDGGVLEVSTDNGSTWVDLGDNMVQNGYNQTIRVNDDSPISDRPAFTGNSNGYIETVVDLQDYKDMDIIVRFRFGCDAAVGGDGWYVDNIQFFDNYYFITNTACFNFNDEEVCSSSKTVIFSKLPTSTNELELDLDISITPNPNNGSFNLNLNSKSLSETRILISSIDGKLIDQRIIPRPLGDFTFDLSNLASGMYIMQIQKDGGQLARKIIVQ